MAEMKPYYSEGLYLGEIIEHNISKAGTGTPQLVISCKILGMLEEGRKDPIPCTFQYTRSIYWSLTERTLPYVTEKLKRLNFDGDKITQLDPGSGNHISLKGKPVELWCSHEAGQHGGQRERWDVAGPQPTIVRQNQPLSSSELRQLDMLFGKSLGEKKGKPNGPPIPSPRPSQVDSTEITDDDLPPF